MGVAFTSSVAGGFDSHQTRVHRVLYVAFQNAVFDQDIALAGIAFVVDIERATAIRQSAVV